MNQQRLLSEKYSEVAIIVRHVSKSYNKHLSQMTYYITKFGASPVQNSKSQLFKKGRTMKNHKKLTQTLHKNLKKLPKNLKLQSILSVKHIVTALLEQPTELQMKTDMCKSRQNRQDVYMYVLFDQLPNTSSITPT